jgi:hypothetical protein
MCVYGALCVVWIGISGVPVAQGRQGWGWRRVDARAPRRQREGRGGGEGDWGLVSTVAQRRMCQIARHHVGSVLM